MCEVFAQYLASGGEIAVVKNTKGSFQMTCPLTDTVIDSDLCVEIQECIEGNVPVTLELEEFAEVEDCQEICAGCKYHI